MGLDFSTLLNAALGGAANYSGGKRAGRKSKLEDAINQENLASQKLYRQSQTEALSAQAAERRDRIEHPEKYRNLEGRATPAHEAFRSTVDELVAKGETLENASKKARLLYGKNEDDPPAARGPVYGSPEYLSALERVESVRDRHQTGRDTGESGSDKAMKDRREYMQSRIAYWSNQGYGIDEATSKANTEYDAADHASGPFRDVQSGSSTAQALARSIPTGGANAGTRGVKPTVTSSTEKHNPVDPTSPKKGAVRQATDAELDDAMDAVGNDAAEVRKYLAKKNLVP